MELISTTVDGFIFNFNREFIQEVNYTHKVNISPAIRKKILHYLVSEQVLIFCSYYRHEPVIKTIVFPEGKIVQQIADNYLLYPELVNLVIQSHYLVIAQLLSLKSGKNRKLNKLFLLLVIIIMIVIILYLLIK
jgi:hypothetical protein